jgi:hypothetical protein
MTADVRRPLLRKAGLCSSGMFQQRRLVAKDVSGQPIGPDSKVLSTLRNVLFTSLLLSP